MSLRNCAGDEYHSGNGAWSFSLPFQEPDCRALCDSGTVQCDSLFSTPYLMMKESLAKMNASWETTAMLMGDNWLKTIVRIVTPNALSTIIEVFSYYFINAMVTISAVIFLAGARTMVITTKISKI